MFIQVVELRSSDKLKPERYPSFTMIRQALGAVAVGWEALQLRVPEVGACSALPHHACQLVIRGCDALSNVF